MIPISCQKTLLIFTLANSKANMHSHLQEVAKDLKICIKILLETKIDNFFNSYLNNFLGKIMILQTNSTILEEARFYLPLR